MWWHCNVRGAGPLHRTLRRFLLCPVTGIIDWGLSMSANMFPACFRGGGMNCDVYVLSQTSSTVLFRIGTAGSDTLLSLYVGSYFGAVSPGAKLGSSGYLQRCCQDQKPMFREVDINYVEGLRCWYSRMFGLVGLALVFGVRQATIQGGLE